MQPDGGFLEVEPSIEAMIALAKAAGAEVRTGETVRAIKPAADGVRDRNRSRRDRSRRRIVAAGAWVSKLLPDLPVKLRVTRQVQAWFQPQDASPFEAGRFPVFLLESRHGVHYGFPPHGGAGVKIAKHHHADETVDPDTVDRTDLGRGRSADPRRDRRPYPGRERAADRRQDLPLHRYAGPRLHHRHAARRGRT